MDRLVLVTHTDLDGVGSAAVYLRLAGRSVDDPNVSIVFTEPYKLVKVLKSVPSRARIAVMDLGPNASTFDELVATIARLREEGAAVEWYDHHRWDETWIARLREVGVSIFVDTSTCATGVVAKYASKLYGVDVDDHVKRLVSAVCAADLWRWDDPLAPRLFRIAERYRGRKGDRWRRSLVKGFSEGGLWWPELSEALNEYLKREFEGFNYVLRNSIVIEAGGCRVAVALKKPGPPSPSIVGNALLDRLRVDVVAIVRTRGRGVSFRSRSVNVREIAVAMGGGGHPRAAGAPLQLPLLLRIITRLYPKVKLRYAAARIAEVVEAKGCTRID